MWLNAQLTAYKQGQEGVVSLAAFPPTVPLLHQHTNSFYLQAVDLEFAYSICLSINMGSVYQMVQQNKLPSLINLHWIMLPCFYCGSSTGFVSVDAVWHRNHAGRMAPVEYSHPILQHYVLHK